MAESTELAPHLIDALAAVNWRSGLLGRNLWQELLALDLIERVPCQECPECNYRNQEERVSGCTVNPNRLTLARMWRLTKVGQDILGELNGWGH